MRRPRYSHEYRNAGGRSEARVVRLHGRAFSPFTGISILHRTFGNGAVGRLLTARSEPALAGMLFLRLRAGLMATVCNPSDTDVKGVQDFAMAEVPAEACGRVPSTEIMK